MARVPEHLTRIWIEAEAHRIARRMVMTKIYASDSKPGHFSAKEIKIGARSLIDTDPSIMETAHRRVWQDIGQ